MGSDQRYHLMVVDDDPSLRITLAGIMEGEGYDVIEAEDGIQAVELARRFDIPLIFMDIKMRGPNGVETYREIKKTKPDSVVVMMTGFSVEDLVKDALEEGALAVVYKPFDVGQIIDIVRSVIQTTFVLVMDGREADREALRVILEETVSEYPRRRTEARLCPWWRKDIMTLC